jgi:hypothetical protein
MQSSKNLCVGLSYASWSLCQTITVRVFPNANEQLANGSLYARCIKGALRWWFA